MKGLGLAPEIPEDLYHLIKKAVSMRKHLELFRKDKDGKFRLILVESRIHRLARYYKVLHTLLPPVRVLCALCLARCDSCAEIIWLDLQQVLSVIAAEAAQLVSAATASKAAW